LVLVVEVVDEVLNSIILVDGGAMLAVFGLWHCFAFVARAALIGGIGASLKFDAMILVLANIADYEVLVLELLRS